MNHWPLKGPAAVVSLVLACLLTASGASGDAPEKFSLRSPYDFGPHQHKVQLHVHTTRSDGDHDAEWVMGAYAQLGYAAVAITDHDYKRYKASLVDPQGHGIIYIPAVEYSGDRGGRSWRHTLGINIATIHHADGLDARQAQIDQAKKEGGLAFLCHPYDENVHRRGWNEQDLLGMVKDYTGIEIQNGASYHTPGERNYPYKVDLALTSGRRVNLIAVDDFHRNPAEAMDRGYVVINSERDAKTLTRQDVIAALSTGNYFAAGRLSTTDPVPPHFTNISVDGTTVKAETNKKADIEFITSRNNYYREGPRYAQKTEGVTAAEYAASYEDGFVRVKATYTENDKTSYAWSNPIYCEK